MNIKCLKQKNCPSHRNACWWSGWLAIFVLNSLTFIGSAQFIVDVGSIQLQPNLPNQSVTLQVQNTGDPDAVFGIQFNIQIADGEEATLAPTITAVDILTDTVFELDNTSVGGQQDTVHRWELTTLDNPSLPNPTVASGFSTIATLQIDTTGFSSGSWGLSLSTPAGPTIFFDADGNDRPISLIDGTISVVPEPSAFGFGISVALIGFAVFKQLKKQALKNT